MIARRVARLLLNQTSRNHRLSLLENLNHLDGFYSYPEGGDLFKEFVSLSPEHQLPVLKRIVSLYEQERLSWGQKQEQATRTKTIQGVKCDFRICAREKPEIQLDPLVKVLAQFSEDEFQRALPHVIQWHTEFSLIKNGICETEGMSFISNEYGKQTLYLQNAAPRFARVFEELRKTDPSEWPKKCQDLAPADFSLKTGD